MTCKSVIAKEVAKMLLEINAISINISKPFTHTSGRLAPVYVDCRKIISYPRVRARIVEYALETIEHNIGYARFDVVAGGETAGIAYATLIAESLLLPMIYVRKKAKGFGKNARIEGDFSEGARAILIEDLATDGGSKINFCQAMREAGLEVAHSFVVFYYNSFPQTKAELEKAGINLHWLTTWQDVLKHCKESNILTDNQIKTVNDYLADPIAWDEANRKLIEN